MATTTSPTSLSPLSTLLSPSRAHHLATTHLLSVFSNAPSPTQSAQPAAAERALYQDLYAPHITVHDNESNLFTGHDGVRELVGRLVGRGGQFEGWRFVVRGEVKLCEAFVWVGWGFGPSLRGEQAAEEGTGELEVDVRVTGADGLLMEKGEDGVVRIVKVWVIIDGVSDVKGQ
jgi:hypothetical protein